MKHLSKFFACSAVALLFASCSSPLQKAMSAVEKEDYTTAATQLSKLTIEDINNMDYFDQCDVFSVYNEVDWNGSDEDKAIIDQSFDIEKVERKESPLYQLISE